MKLEINTTTKEIKILEDVNLAEFLTEIQVLDLNINEYSVIPHTMPLPWSSGLSTSGRIYDPMHTGIMYWTSGNYTNDSINSFITATL